MSIHSSLKVSGAGGGQRNVWSRMERIAALKKANKWKDGDRVTGLPKVRTAFKVKAKKKAEEPGAAAAAPAAAAATPAPAAAAPAKETKPAAKAAPKK
jgi:small basic protein (TIGR04137 family)